MPPKSCNSRFLFSELQSLGAAKDPRGLIGKVWRPPKEVFSFLSDPATLQLSTVVTDFCSQFPESLGLQTTQFLNEQSLSVTSLKSC